MAICEGTERIGDEEPVPAQDARGDASQRHVVWNHFTNLRLRQMLVDWSGDARTQLALFRMASRRHAGTAWLADFNDRLQQASPEFRTWCRSTRCSSASGRL